MTWRYRLTLVVFILLFFLVIGRLFYWQIVKAQELSFLGQSQYQREISLLPKRGEIKTSDGFPIASNKISYLVFANPRQIKDKKKAADILSSVLKIDIASLSASLSYPRFWVPLKRDTDIVTKQRLESLKLEGVGFEEHYTRFYPEGSIAAQLLGFVGKDQNGVDKGYFGIEGYYDRLLSGKQGKAIEIQDALGRPILAKLQEEGASIDGSNLVLNINRQIQFLVEEKLKKGIEKYGASSGMVVVLNPKTGAVLAMSSYPSFDPTSYQNYSQDLYKNPIISSLYEPGSTFKSLVMAFALDAKVVKPDTRCTICGGPITIGDYQIRTWNNKYFNNTNMIDVIKNSDNTGMVFVAKSLGLDRMFSYLEKFGVGEISGIDLQGEVASILRAKNSWYPIDLATAGFGQGISVTPIELLSAFSSIANGGKRIEPHVVAQIETSEGEKIVIPAKALGEPIREETTKVMTEILVNAVNKGEAKWTRLKGYRIAGKTGTAQIPIAGHYDPNKTIASFIGFAPADDPKFSVLVILNQPTTSPFGSETAAPIFFDIAKDILSYYGIAPKE